MAATKKGSKPDLFSGLQKAKAVEKKEPAVQAKPVVEEPAPVAKAPVKEETKEENFRTKEVQAEKPAQPEAKSEQKVEEQPKAAEILEVPEINVPAPEPAKAETSVQKGETPIVQPISPAAAPKKRGRKAATPTGDTEEICRQTYYYTYEEMAAIKTVGFLEDRTHSEIVRELIDYALEQKYPGLLGRADVLKKAENLREKIKNRQSIDD
jgi:hypothetical protein